MPDIGTLFGRERELPSSAAGPIWVGEVELGRALSLEPVLAPPRPFHRRALLLVRLHGVPVGAGTVALGPDGKTDLSDLARKIGDECRSAILEHLGRDADAGSSDRVVRLPAAAGLLQPGALAAQIRAGLGEWCGQRQHSPRPGITAVLFTADGRATERALLSLARLSYPDFEVLVVDTGRQDPNQLLIESGLSDDHRLRPVRVADRGLEAARRAALAAAHHRYVAFVGGEVEVDAHWLEGLARGFASDQAIGAVFGLLASGEVAAEAPDGGAEPWWSALQPCCVGAGEAVQAALSRSSSAARTANFAVDRQRVGSVALNSDGGKLVACVLAAGALARFEPSAIVWQVPGEKLEKRDPAGATNDAVGSTGAGAWRGHLPSGPLLARLAWRARDAQRGADPATARLESLQTETTTVANERRRDDVPSGAEGSLS